MPKFKDLEQLAQSASEKSIGGSKKSSLAGSTVEGMEGDYVSQEILKKRDEYMQKIFSTM